ncbi:bifunctional YncE family protein/alkaline phosphatase family protein [Amycolatopsis alkalitolerans]|uniref:Bifunctional YncE family protein/alkaline phosphatase family protein n=1 Tax=Amycolatopsis alkalitolerans TaxID=2547244 RepID=A0A5C4LVZ7_9PSEU|nr:bifunctional YncE family protein/alkaline phosphatase family protein [Amycolatopsis alkalitolerans]TNC23543.1 bifunctional YncE family protein/alkaline phosphatase family protein [Amycolatopsis alkalitolerans]
MRFIRKTQSGRRPPRARTTAAIALGTVAVGTAVAVAATQAVHAGPAGDGTAVTPVGFRVTPPGQQTTLGDLPLSSAASPDGKSMLVVNAGDGDQSLQMIDTASGKVIQTITYKAPQAIFAGVTFSPDGQRAYVSGGGNNVIRTYSVSGQHLTETATIALPTKNPSGASVNMYPAGLAVTPDGKRLVVADQLADAATVVDLATGATSTTGVGHAPYGVVLSKDGGTAYVTNQGANTVSVLDIAGAAPVVRTTIGVGTHPNNAVPSADGKRLYVADGDSDQVSVLDTVANRVSQTISLAPYQNAPVGANPDGLALSPGQHTLYVANSGDNDIAVVDLDRAEVRGLIPTAWYPTSVQVVGKRLRMVNAKGLGAGPNPNGPNPYTDDQRRKTDPEGFNAQYVGSMIKGSLSTIDVPDAGTLANYTRQVNDNDGFAQGAGVRGTGGPGTAIIPRHAGDPTPIKHVIYVVKENRTYDQEFGSLGKGNGDPSLNLFGDGTAPNLRALERQYADLDNFYANAEVSAQGWNWAVASNSNPYTEQTWVANYSGRNHPYPSENGDPAIAPNRDPADAYIWDRLADAHVSFRNYGYYVSPNSTNQEIASDPRLNANTDHAYRGFDLNCPDSANSFKPLSASCGSPRIDEWQKEFGGYVTNHNLPTMEFVRLPNDHTSSTAPGKPTPKAYVGDNDWATGQLVDAVSHSPYWKDTAIFVTEDDAQAGPDHVDAHRTTSEVISPYTRTGKVDSTFYNTASMLRTMELILGIKPLTQFDAFATPMVGAFTNKPDFTPYTAVKPTTDLTAVNTANSPMAAQSAQQDLSQADRINEYEFNQATWESVKGANSPMPLPLSNGVPFVPPANPTGPNGSDG